jgi:hypothetical protein
MDRYAAMRRGRTRPPSAIRPVKRCVDFVGVFRRLGLLLGGFALAMVLATNAFASAPVRVTLTRALPRDKSPGEHVLVRWTFRDSSGHIVRVNHVVLTIICPTRDSTTRTLAVLQPDGAYRANAVVPPGGIGNLSIKTSGRTFLIGNPFRR